MTNDEYELNGRAEYVSRRYNGILPPNEVLYVESIRYSSGRSLQAFNTYESDLSSCTNASDLIAAVQEAIGHAAALSRYFWPSGGGSSSKAIKQLRMARADKLRSSYEIGEESPLHVKSIRDVCKHFDERLDLYLLVHDAGHFFPSPMIGSHVLADDPAAKVFKLLDADSRCLVLLGEKYDFDPIKDEVKRIFDHSSQILKTGGRL